MTYIVMVRSASMPASVKARYLKVALVELEPGFEGEPKMISERAHGVKRIVELRDRLHAGRATPTGNGPNTAAEIARRELLAEADRLNGLPIVRVLL